MTRKRKLESSGPFYELDKRKQKAVALIFEDEMSDEEIAKEVGRSPATLYVWKKNPTFKAAQRQYNRLIVKRSYESKAIKTLHNLLDAKSEMVRMQTAQFMLKLSGMASENSTPELDHVKLRKLNAEADLTEEKVKMMKDNGQDVATALDDIMNKLIKESDKKI